MKMLKGKNIIHNPEQFAIMRIEPSKWLSKLLGYPYTLERRFTIEEAVKLGFINDHDITEMKQGKEIHKEIEVAMAGAK